jgi:hypothetical protein
MAAFSAAAPAVALTVTNQQLVGQPLGVVNVQATGVKQRQPGNHAFNLGFACCGQQ